MTGARQHRFDGLGIILRERLGGEDPFARVVDPHLAVDHLGDDRFGLATRLRLGGQTLALGGNRRGGQLLGQAVRRAEGGDVHRDVPQHLVSARSPLRLEQHPQRAVVVRVGRNRTLQLQQPGDHDVLADLVQDLFVQFPQRLARFVGARLGQQLIDRRGTGTVQQLLGQLVAQPQEVFALGHGGRLALDFNHHRPRAIGGGEGRDAAFRGHAVGDLELESLDSLFQDLNRLLLIAPGLGQSLLAFHHGQVGALAQCPHRLGRNLRHLSSLLQTA